MFTRYGKSWCPYRDRCPETRGGLTVWEFLAAPFSACLLVPSEQGAPGRMAPVGPQCAGQRRAVSRLPTSPGHGVRVIGLEQEAVLWASLGRD